MSLPEIIALISTIVCVILSARENILAWPIGIISVLSLIWVYIGGGLYAQIGLQTVFLIQCIIGWVNWGKKDDIYPNKEDKNTVIVHVCCAMGLGVIYAIGILVFYQAKDVIFSYIDGIAAFIALLGNWYLTKKILQAWPLFMSYNLMMVFLLASQGIYLLALLNIVLFLISFNAYRTWKRNLNVV